MEIILHESISNLGEPGDVVNVKDGYARNFLIPRKMAAIASQNNVKELEHQKRVAAVKLQQAKATSEELAKKLAELSLTITKEAGEEEKLFGSVTTMDIANALRNEGYTIDKRHIKLEEPIKKIGVFEVAVRLHPEVEGTVKIWVVKK